MMNKEKSASTWKCSVPTASISAPSITSKARARSMLAKKDVSAGGKHHLIPLDWVDHVDDSVHLKKTSQEAIVGWRMRS